MRARNVAAVGAAMLVVAAGALAALLLVAPATPPKPLTTFADHMQPFVASVIDPSAATVRFSAKEPRWGNLEQTRWDREGAFTYSLDPHPLGTVAGQGKDAARGAEFAQGNSARKNADVTFTVTGRRFAIHYRTFVVSDAMVWIDGHPVASEPVAGKDPTGKGSDNWIVVTLPDRRTVDVRFAGPVVFIGVDSPADDSATITATPPRFTIGVVSDSLYERSLDLNSMSTSAAPTLATLTGFRVWNMAQGGTGYVNDGTTRVLDRTRGSRASRFGSAQRLESALDAPIDALLVNGSINDAPFSVREHRAAVDAYLSYFEAHYPALPIVIVGLEPLSFGDTPTGRWPSSPP